MANCDQPFRRFNDRVRLGTSYKSDLRVSRDSLRDKVRAKFAEKGYDVKFHGQGSFAMGTTIRPANGDYDIDDGIYILQDQRPTESIATLHRWVVDAAENHTSQRPTDKNPCVRVHFKAGHHVDLVVYHRPTDSRPTLAHKRDGWIPSDPKAFVEWFNAAAHGNAQLRRLVRCFKAWSDNLQGQMPPGLILTILTVNNYSMHDRDDVAFLETMRSMYAHLYVQFVCNRPTYPSEDLFAGYEDARRTYFLERLGAFVQTGDEAIADASPVSACLKWRHHFGDRFICGEVGEDLDNAKAHGARPFINTDARSA